MVYTSEEGLTGRELTAALERSLEGKKPSKVLLLPPDYTRMYSGAGRITEIYYRLLKDSCDVDIMPALGTHAPMTRSECEAFFGPEVPFEKIIVHDWRKDVVKIGEIGRDFVSEVSEGLVNDPIDVEVNRRIVSGGYDLIISIGQVVPHEVAGMANYSKNIFVGCGGASMINSSHMLGAFYGIERIMGRDFTPVRRVFDLAEEKFLGGVPLMYVLTVTTNRGDDVFIHGLYIGRSRGLFEQAVADSRRYNITHLDRPLKKAVVFLDPREFKSTWLGNKAIYRTRMAMADGGELIILAPGVSRFGEDPENDRLIAKYGYAGRENILKMVRENADLRANLSAAAHLIHGSPDGRFSVTYCAPLLGEEKVRSAGFGYADYAALSKKYPPSLPEGFSTVGGEEIFYIPNPALGLWSAQRDKI